MMLQKQKVYPILFLVFAAFFILSQIAFTTENTALLKLATPFRAVFPYKWGFFSPAKPYNYIVEVNYYDASGALISNEKISDKIIANFSNGILNGNAFMKFELLNQACLTYHYVDYLREQHSEEIKDYAAQLNRIQKYMVRLIQQHGYPLDCNTFDYVVYITDMTTPHLKLKIYQSGPFIHEKYRDY